MFFMKCRIEKREENRKTIGQVEVQDIIGGSGFYRGSDRRNPLSNAPYYTCQTEARTQRLRNLKIYTTEVVGASQKRLVQPRRKKRLKE